LERGRVNEFRRWSIADSDVGVSILGVDMVVTTKLCRDLFAGMQQYVVAKQQK
jgi:hypothetical protein